MKYIAKVPVHCFRCVHQANIAMIAESSIEIIYVLYPGEAGKSNNYY